MSVIIDTTVVSNVDQQANTTNQAKATLFEGLFVFSSENFWLYDRTVRLWWVGDWWNTHPLTDHPLSIRFAKVPDLAIIVTKSKQMLVL